MSIPGNFKVMNLSPNLRFDCFKNRYQTLRSTGNFLDKKLSKISLTTFGNSSYFPNTSQIFWKIDPYPNLIIFKNQSQSQNLEKSISIPIPKIWDWDWDPSADPLLSTTLIEKVMQSLCGDDFWFFKSFRKRLVYGPIPNFEYSVIFDSNSVL